jgi:hypothetical protein
MLIGFRMIAGRQSALTHSYLAASRSAIYRGLIADTSTTWHYFETHWRMRAIIPSESSEGPLLMIRHYPPNSTGQRDICGASTPSARAGSTTYWAEPFK